METYYFRQKHIFSFLNCETENINLKKYICLVYIVEEERQIIVKDGEAFGMKILLSCKNMHVHIFIFLDILLSHLCLYFLF